MPKRPTLNNPVPAQNLHSHTPSPAHCRQHTVAFRFCDILHLRVDPYRQAKSKGCMSKTPRPPPPPPSPLKVELVLETGKYNYSGNTSHKSQAFWRYSPRQDLKSNQPSARSGHKENVDKLVIQFVRSRWMGKKKVSFSWNRERPCRHFW